MNLEAELLECSDQLNYIINSDTHLDNIKQKLKDLSFQLDSILKEYNYKENDEYSKAKLKEINCNLDTLDIMIEEL